MPRPNNRGNKAKRGSINRPVTLVPGSHIHDVFFNLDENATPGAPDGECFNQNEEYYKLYNPSLMEYCEEERHRQRQNAMAPGSDSHKAFFSSLADSIQGIVESLQTGESNENVNADEVNVKTSPIIRPQDVILERQETDASSITKGDSMDDDDDATIGYEITMNAKKEQAVEEECTESTDVSATGYEDVITESKKKSVRFGSIEVRDYERVMDSTGMYLGLALGWGYNIRPATPVAEQDKVTLSKVKKKSANVKKEHGGDASRLKRTNGNDRFVLLLNYGYTQRELKRASADAAKFYKQREKERKAADAKELESSKLQPNARPQTKAIKARTLRRSMFGL